MAQDNSTKDTGDARRSFLKGAAVAAGAAAAATVTTQANAQYTKEELSLDGISGVASIAPAATLNVAFSPRRKVSLQEIQFVVEQTLGRTGCPTCGLVGLDIRLGLDDVLFAEEGVTAVLEGARTL